MDPVRCRRCRRILHHPPISGYGPVCARRRGLLPTGLAVTLRRPQTQHPLPHQPTLFDLPECDDCDD